MLDIHRRVQSHPDPLRWLEERREDFAFSLDAMPEHTPWGRLLLDDGRALADYWAGELEMLGEELAFDPVLETNYGASLAATTAHLRALSQAMGQGWDRAAELFPVPFPRVGAKKGADPALKERAKVLRDLCKKQVTRLGERFSVSRPAGAMYDLRCGSPGYGHTIRGDGGVRPRADCPQAPSPSHRLCRRGAPDGAPAHPGGRPALGVGCRVVPSVCGDHGGRVPGHQRGAERHFRRPVHRGQACSWWGT